MMRRVQERRAARRLSPGEVAAIAEAAESRAGANGELPATAREAIFRSLEQLPCGNFRLRPGPRELPSVLDALDELNLLELYPQLACRCLVVCGTAVPEAPPEQRWQAELQRAHIAGETLELQALSRSHPTLQLELVPSTHARVLREPRVAGLISTFLDQVAD